ncbi:hypothetical protein PF005_g7688 [Phytophthora fragariae]|uniref:Uncharacterized protein n=1 Tax=Phytophthora fragariae TaxID=53985 RepID=A0A6A3YM16_9STRA|nr:hypothetical protein PF003_g36385 [Phytophthora fragariae]KAE8941669.1 hypothetical protein PF009_g8546 [Phytophthora fragariae]KAE9005116.1 hypothetical protein PF011_g12179 [Phytophthora fragariae]KAE9106802.1 hypothetical protein PF010_g12497 [Phytophthora fragariae]KAE9108886.1 hypothetical protein PF007_g12476 [Phytophthora fragariae]
MQKLHISTEGIYKMMAHGMLDSLTVIRHDRIDPTVAKKFKMALRVKDRAYRKVQWDDFWAYIRQA